MQSGPGRPRPYTNLTAPSSLARRGLTSQGTQPPAPHGAHPAPQPVPAAAALRALTVRRACPPAPLPVPIPVSASKAPLKMASGAPEEELATQGCPAPATEEQAPRPGAPGEEAAREAGPEGAGPQVEEAASRVAAALTWLLGEPVLWLGYRADELLSWKRPLSSLLAFLGANLLFW